jgi:hypothetical protein
MFTALEMEYSGYSTFESENDMDLVKSKIK